MNPVIPTLRRGPAARLLPVALGLVLGGCTVGPDYTPPEPALPAAWLEAGPTAASTSTSAGARAWWQALADPTLAGLVRAAHSGSFDLRIAAARVAEAYALRRGARAERLPAVDAVGAATRRKDSGNAFFAFGDDADSTRSEFSAGVEAGWELDLWGRVRRLVEAADADVQAAEELRQDVVRVVVAQLAGEYVELRGAERELAVARRNVESQRGIVELAEQLTAAGMGSFADVARARGLLRETEAIVPLLEARIAGGAHRIAVLIGGDARQVKQRLAAAATLPATPPALQLGVPADLLRARPDVRAAERELAAATARIGVATADLYPRITLNGRSGFDATEASELFEADSVSFLIGPALRWPLLDFGRVRSRINAQGARQQAALARFEQVVAQAVTEVETALASLARRAENRAALAEALAHDQEAQRLIETRYREGATSFLEVLDAQRRVLIVEGDLARAQTALLLDFVGLNRALGAPASDPAPVP